MKGLSTDVSAAVCHHASDRRCDLLQDEKLSKNGKRSAVLTGKRSGFSQQSEWNREQSRLQIAGWLESLNLGEGIAQKFEDAEIDPDVLVAMDDSHLAQMGIPSSARAKISDYRQRRGAMGGKKQANQDV